MPLKTRRVEKLMRVKSIEAQYALCGHGNAVETIILLLMKAALKRAGKVLGRRCWTSAPRCPPRDTFPRETTGPLRRHSFPTRNGSLLNTASSSRLELLKTHSIEETVAR
ncbi:hypothetical protein TNCV_2391271 [Trichonephila clavipes]|nr:hypothetical protein TNCV_2391271 [Trichonephila clavipes]